MLTYPTRGMTVIMYFFSFTAKNSLLLVLSRYLASCKPLGIVVVYPNCPSI